MNLEEDAGRMAAAAGEPRSACPHSPSSPSGRAWCRGWASEETIRRKATGAMASDTEAMKAIALEQAARWDGAYRPDPVAEILGQDDLEPVTIAGFDVVVSSLVEPGTVWVGPRNMLEDLVLMMPIFRPSSFIKITNV